MTEEERQKLDQTHAVCMQLKRAFLDVPDGHTESLIKRIVHVVETAERSGWAGKWAVRVLLTGGAIVGALSVIKGGVK